MLIWLFEKLEVWLALLEHLGKLRSTTGFELDALAGRESISGALSDSQSIVKVNNFTCSSCRCVHLVVSSLQCGSLLVCCAKRRKLFKCSNWVSRTSCLPDARVYPAEVRWSGLQFGAKIGRFMSHLSDSLWKFVESKVNSKDEWRVFSACGTVCGWLSNSWSLEWQKSWSGIDRF